MTAIRKPPDVGEAPGKGPHQSAYDQQLGLDRTADLPHGSPTLDYLRGRERVLGRRMQLHDEPAIAARQLVEMRGAMSARAWARKLLNELEIQQ